MVLLGHDDGQFIVRNYENLVEYNFQINRVMMTMTQRWALQLQASLTQVIDNHDFDTLAFFEIYTRPLLHPKSKTQLSDSVRF